MGKKLKKGKTGNAAQYLTRNQAIKKLQLRLSEFRRLCILKGIHPREPKKKVHGANKTYYHAKDINWLMHEPLLNVFRNLKAYEKKVRKAKAKLNNDLAQRLAKLKPTYKLDHLVKERYPSFIDALRDLDDPLTMVHLFATLPAEKRYDIPVKAVDMARRLAMEFTAYVVRTNALRKVFVSIKGYYYQAEIMGQSVTWLVPHQLAQVLPVDVDYKVMLTFLEFYETLLQFVNFKLYHTLGLKYPPMLDPKLEEAAAGLASIMKDLAGLRDEVDKQVQEQRQELQQLESAEVSERLQSLQNKIKEIAGSAADANGTAAAKTSGHHAMEDDEGDSDNEGDDVSDVSVDADLEIDSGDDDESGSGAEDGTNAGEDEAEEDDDDDDNDGQDDAAMPAAELAARQDANSHASTSGSTADGLRAAGGALGVNADDEGTVCTTLFKGLVFFLAREVPREPLLFVIRAFGGVAAWDGEGSPFSSNDEAITHQVVDRPMQGHRFLSREYVQPQWVFDSANFRVLMPTEMYVPGKAPPPHLSPFTNDEEEGYTPEFAQTVKRLQEAAKAARLRSAGVVQEGEFVAEGQEQQLLLEGAGAAEDADAAERAYHADLAKELRGADEAGEEADAGSDSEAEQQEQEQDQDQDRKPAGRKRSAAELEGEELEAMKDIMMTRKNRKLYERIQRAREGKHERVQALEQKKRRLAGAQQ